MTQGEKEIGLFPCSGGVFTLNLDQNTRNDWLTILTCKIEIENKKKVVDIKLLGLVWLSITRKRPEDLRGILGTFNHYVMLLGRKEVISFVRNCYEKMEE